MYGEQRNRVLAAEPGRIQLLGLLLLHQDQVVEKSVQRRPSLQRAPLFRQVEEAVQVEPSREAGGTGHGFHLLPRPGDAEDAAHQLHQTHSLGVPQQLPVDAAELRQRAA